jgi:hypothetical protein
MQEVPSQTMIRYGVAVTVPIPFEKRFEVSSLKFEARRTVSSHLKLDTSKLHTS